MKRTLFVSRGPELPVDRKARKRLRRLTKALRTGELRLRAVVDGVEVLVPLEVFRGNWLLKKGGATDHSNDFLVVYGADGEEVLPRYYNPIFTTPH